MINTIMTATQTIQTYQSFQLFRNQCMKVLLILGFLTFPLSTFLTGSLDILIVLFWFIDPKFLDKIRRLKSEIFVYPLFGFIGICLFSITYSSAEFQDISHQLLKTSRLLLLPIMASEYLVHQFFIKKTPLLAYSLFTLSVLVITVTEIYSNHAYFFKQYIFTNFFVSLIVFLNLHLLCNQFFLGHRKNYSKLFFLMALTVYLLIYAFNYNLGRTGHVLVGILTLYFIWQRFSGWSWFLISFLGFILTLGLFQEAKFSSYRFLEAQNEFMEFICHQDQKKTQAELTKESSTGQRLSFYQGGLNLIQEKPWLGHGLGSFKKIYREYSERSHTAPTNNPHNEYLNIALQTGLFGLSCLMLWGFALFNPPQPNMQNLHHYFLQGLVLAMAIGSFFNSWLMDFRSVHALLSLGSYAFAAQKKADCS
ncbi:MAG: O-antigen ligase family protein [Gammaproteobacteria bacterium]